MDGHLHRILVIALYVVGAGVAGLFVSLIWNIGAPASYRFLGAAELGALQKLLVQRRDGLSHYCGSEKGVWRNEPEGKLDDNSMLAR